MNPRQDSGRAFSGRYRLLEFVGEGSQARVYLAEDLTLRRRVALKIVRAGIAERAGFVDRFAAEMRATAALSHPRLVPMYDWGLTPQPYVVTEHLTGGSLGVLIAQGFRLTASQGLMVGLEAARALLDIHRSGRAHLGLTPAAILFDSSARPYVSDLGLAAAVAWLDTTGTADTTDTTDTPEVSPGYTLVEQSQDVHDLAVVLCEAVTGNKHPSLDGSDPVGMAALGPLQALLEHATAADPVARLTAEGFASELLRVAPLLPRPDSLPRPVAENPADDDASRPGAPAEAFSQIGPTVSEHYGIPLDDAPRRRWPGLVLALLLVLGGAVAGAWALLSESSVGTVPELTGLPEAAASEAAAEAGWTLNPILVRAPDTTRGEIVGSEPAAGEPLSEGAALDVFVSLGEPLVLVSELRSLYGLTVDEAAAELSAAGLVVADEALDNDEAVPAGNVIGLALAEEVHELEAGSEVGLLVSQGPADRRVPEVPPGATLRDASAALTALRLSPQAVSEFSDDFAEGAVIGFLPASGAALPVGSTVRVRISQGPMLPPPQEPLDDDDAATAEDS
ncbi:MAG: PASTA domain-containing protein [Acidimicrobiaceae bacterium]|nr:PASTA domain-containing protein [Acidimicrobiaceae bacterium]